MTDSRIGSEIDGRYLLERELGRGAGGVVYAARQLAVDRLVAVKLLNDSDDPGFKKRFENEARAVGKLNHPNIITLHDFGWSDEVDTYFMVTEFIDGESLADRMMEYMSTDLILHVCLKITSALHHAHGQGILHRDLKPENIMLIETDGRWPTVKVLDFGLARMFETERRDREDLEDELQHEAAFPRLKTPAKVTPPPILQRHVQPQIQGTPAYMSPEQAKGVRELDARTDLYSLGIMLFELLEGHPPYDADSREVLLQLQIEGDIPGQAWDETPDEVRELIDELLQKSPGDRPASALAVADVLEAALDQDSSLEERFDDAEWKLEPLSETGETVEVDEAAEPSDEEAAEPFDDFSDLNVETPAGKKRTLAAVALIAILLVVGLIVMTTASEDAEIEVAESEIEVVEAEPAAAVEVPDPEPTFQPEVAQPDPEAARDEVQGQTRRALSIAKTAADTRVKTLKLEASKSEREEPRQREKEKKEKKPRLRELKLSL